MKLLKRCSRCRKLKASFAFHKRTAVCKKCRQAQNKEWNQRNQERYRAMNRKWYHDRMDKWRFEMIAAYGGKCSCCGEARVAFLTLDHVGGGGNAHRRLMGGNFAVIRDLRRCGWPKKGFRLLCMNCNWVMRHGQPCPHTFEVL